MLLLWEQNYQEEDWGFFLIDARNTCNKENNAAILWAVWNEWPSGAQFTLSFYCHWDTVVVWDLEGSSHFLHSKEVVTQGDPLYTTTYGIGFHSLI